MEILLIAAFIIGLVFLYHIIRPMIWILVIGACLALYYPYMPEDTKEQISREYSYYKERLRKSWEVFNATE